MTAIRQIGCATDLFPASGSVCHQVVAGDLRLLE
jgi:hypothetical protein